MYAIRSYYARRQLVRIVEGTGRRICLHEGAVCITESGEPSDIVLEPGACYSYNFV